MGKISPCTGNLSLDCPFRSESVQVIQCPNNNYVASFLITGTNSREKWTHVAWNDKCKLLIPIFWKMHHNLLLQVWCRRHCPPGELPNCSHRYSPSAESTIIWTWIQASSGVSKRPAALPAQGCTAAKIWHHIWYEFRQFQSNTSSVSCLQEVFGTVMLTIG